MSLRYWDIVFQTVDRLNLVINYFAQTNPSFGKVTIAPMANFQKDIASFMSGAAGETARIMVTHSGIQVEGGRQVTDFTKTMGQVTQIIEHGIEVHICTKQMMKLTATDMNEMTSLGLEWVVAEALKGLQIYYRDPVSGVVDLNNQMSVASAGTGMFHIETMPDREYNGSLFSTVRFQIMEVVRQMSSMSPEQILGVYTQIILNEYPAAIGGTPPNSPTETDIVDSNS